MEPSVWLKQRSHTPASTKNSLDTIVKHDRQSKQFFGRSVKDRRRGGRLQHNKVESRRLDPMAPQSRDQVEKWRLTCRGSRFEWQNYVDFRMLNVKLYALFVVVPMPIGWLDKCRHVCQMSMYYFLPLGAFCSVRSTVDLSICCCARHPIGQ